MENNRVLISFEGGITTSEDVVDVILGRRGLDIYIKLRGESRYYLFKYFGGQNISGSQSFSILSMIAKINRENDLRNSFIQSHPFLNEIDFKDALERIEKNNDTVKKEILTIIANESDRKKNKEQEIDKLVTYKPVSEEATVFLEIADLLNITGPNKGFDDYAVHGEKLSQSEKDVIRKMYRDRYCLGIVSTLLIDSISLYNSESEISPINFVKKVVLQRLSEINNITTADGKSAEHSVSLYKFFFEFYYGESVCNKFNNSTQKISYLKNYFIRVIIKFYLKKQTENQN